MLFFFVPRFPARIAAVNTFSPWGIVLYWLVSEDVDSRGSGGARSLAGMALQTLAYGRCSGVQEVEKQILWRGQEA